MFIANATNEQNLLMDWDDIRRQFLDYEGLMSNVSLPSPEDLELYKLHLISYGQIPYNHYRSKINYGYFIHIEGKERYEHL